MRVLILAAVCFGSLWGELCSLSADVFNTEGNITAFFKKTAAECKKNFTDISENSGILSGENNKQATDVFTECLCGLKSPVLYRQKTREKAADSSKKSNTVKEVNATSGQSVFSNEIKMNLALYRYDKDEIEKLLHTNIPPYQKTEAFYTLQYFKKAEDAVYNQTDNNSRMYQSYFDMFKKHAGYFSYSIDSQKNFVTNRVKIRRNAYMFEALNVKDVSEVIVSKKTDGYVFAIGYQHSDDSSVVLKAERSFEKLKPEITLYAGYHRNENFFNFADGEIYIVREDFTGLKADYSINGENKILLNSEYARDEYKKRYFYKKYISADYVRRYDRNINFRIYAKKTDYSDILVSYSEFGAGVYFSEADTYSKKPHFFVNPVIYYNTEENLGYSFSAGFKKRVIKADELTFFVNVTPDFTELNFNYIYYY